VALWPALLTALADAACEHAQRAGYGFGVSLPTPLRTRPQPLELKLEPPEEFEISDESSEVSAGAKTPVKPRRRLRGLKVREATILRLAQARAIPAVVGVGAQAGRPAGLRFTDVEGLGVGLKNGDVLTRVAGVPAVNRGAVVAAVLAVREQRAPSINAEFWRGDTLWQLVVEMPYLPDRLDSAPPSQQPGPTP
jgi:hypothetical protein